PVRPCRGRTARPAPSHARPCPRSYAHGLSSAFQVARSFWLLSTEGIGATLPARIPGYTGPATGAIDQWCATIDRACENARIARGLPVFLPPAVSAGAEDHRAAHVRFDGPPTHETSSFQLAIAPVLVQTC